MTQHIERLTRLHIDGDPTAYAHLAREQTRRGMWWCVADDQPTFSTWEAVREWAEVEYFPLDLLARVGPGMYQPETVVLLYTRGGQYAGVVRLDLDGRPVVTPAFEGEWGIHRTHTLHAQTLDDISYGPCAPCARVNGYSWPYGPKGERPLCALISLT